MQQLRILSESFKKVGIHSIKLRNLLELRDHENETKQIKTMFPPVDIGSITLVDQIILLALIELVDPERILEIGTYQGYTTRLFVNNSNAKEILSVDLPQSELVTNVAVDVQRILKDGDYNDDYLRAIQNSTGAKYLTGLNSDDVDRVKLIKCDSTKINYDDSVGNVQFAFIDGGHNYDIIKKDTVNVLSQIKSGVIVWHDYSSAIHSDVTKYLHEYSESNQVFFVQGGLCAFQVVRECSNV